MTPVTIEDRRRELERLTTQIRAHPNRDWSEERHRIGVLATQLAASERVLHN
jgi:hypothetical protein